MRTVTATQLRAEQGTTEHAFAHEIAKARTARAPVQITRQTGTTEQREPARLMSHTRWKALVVAGHTPRKSQEWGSRYARTHLRHLLDAALAGTHTVVTVDGVPSAVFVPTRWHERAIRHPKAEAHEVSA